MFPTSGRHCIPPLRDNLPVGSRDDTPHSSSAFLAGPLSRQGSPDSSKIRYPRQVCDSTKHVSQAFSSFKPSFSSLETYLHLYILPAFVFSVPCRKRPLYSYHLFCITRSIKQDHPALYILLCISPTCRREIRETNQSNFDLKVSTL